MANPWRLVCWSDERGREVKRLGCTVGELPAVLDLPFPAGAVVREPVYEYTGGASAFYNRAPSVRLGDRFVDNINQGDRTCVVVAVDEVTGDYLYEYEMPGGRVFLRNQSGKPVSRARLSARWQHLLNGGE